MPKLYVTHTSTTTRALWVDVPDDQADDPESYLYETIEESEGDIVGGGWSIDEIKES